MTLGNRRKYRFSQEKSGQIKINAYKIRRVLIKALGYLNFYRKLKYKKKFIIFLFIFKITDIWPRTEKIYHGGKTQTNKFCDINDFYDASFSIFIALNNALLGSVFANPPILLSTFASVHKYLHLKKTPKNNCRP